MISRTALISRTAFHLRACGTSILWYLVRLLISYFAVSRIAWYLGLVVSRTSWYIILRRGISFFVISRTSRYLALPGIYPVLCGASKFAIFQTSRNLVLRSISFLVVFGTSWYLVLRSISYFMISLTSKYLVPPHISYSGYLVILDPRDISYAVVSRISRYFIHILEPPWSSR